MGRPAYDFLAMHTVQPDGCWYFTGKRNPKGYGLAGMHGSAHRYYYKQLVGPIPEGLTIDHLCKVTYCVNPAPMEPVTVEENTRRARAAKRDRTHCPYGHELTEDNTYTYPVTGSRECKICRRRYVRECKARKRARTTA